MSKEENLISNPVSFEICKNKIQICIFLRRSEIQSDVTDAKTAEPTNTACE